MGTRKVYDLSVKTGSYESNGETKNRWTNVGVVLATDDGARFILMDRTFNPAGVPYDANKGNTIMVAMFEPRQDKQPAKEEPRRQSPFDNNEKRAHAADEFEGDVF